MQLEMELHKLGYKYTGKDSLYNLTWIELMRLVDASRLLEDMSKGVRGGDLDKLDKYHGKVKSKMRQ